MVEIKIADEAVQAAIQKAMLEALTVEAKEELIKNVIKYLCEKDPNYSNLKPRIQIYLESAVQRYAERIMFEHLEKDDSWLREQIESVYTEACKKVFASDSDTRKALVDRVAKAITDSMINDQFNRRY